MTAWSNLDPHRPVPQNIPDHPLINSPPADRCYLQAPYRVRVRVRSCSAWAGILVRRPFLPRLAKQPALVYIVVLASFRNRPALLCASSPAALRPPPLAAISLVLTIPCFARLATPRDGRNGPVIDPSLKDNIFTMARPDFDCNRKASADLGFLPNEAAAGRSRISSRQPAPPNAAVAFAMGLEAVLEARLWNSKALDGSNQVNGSVVGAGFASKH
ncbi:hypothetical protein CPLU01_06502 [Colletotrichum plurivorum]|uniref:Uncharacterized protein n=1 Tax=Colletotrichum plurivorum TaxID=2175906 RepID=A0A8H6KIH1_9PEZI|nr:hypothetical protein CPLU01_06502 [Colletotrichum plurivorum]